VAQPTEGLQRYFYDVGPGDRFLLSAPDAPTANTPLTLIVNWPAIGNDQQ
jgi:hypothetical protein